MRAGWIGFRGPLRVGACGWSDPGVGTLGRLRPVSSSGKIDVVDDKPRRAVPQPAGQTKGLHADELAKKAKTRSKVTPTEVVVAAATGFVLSFAVDQLERLHFGNAGRGLVFIAATLAVGLVPVLRKRRKQHRLQKTVETTQATMLASGLIPPSGRSEHPSVAFGRDSSKEAISPEAVARRMGLS